MIEGNSFLSLTKLEFLLLSSNSIATLHADTFSFMSNLKLLNLSSNLIEIVQPFLFSNLLKLERLDLSSNRINSMSSFSFNRLINLKNLHVNDQNGDFNLTFESNETFSKCESIQTIYLSKVACQLNQNVLVSLFEMKKSFINKTVLNRRYFKSLFLISNYDEISHYDCNLTLYFIRNNIHFNFKTETHIYDYFSQCSNLAIKNFTFLPEDTIVNRFLSFDKHMFTNVLPFFFWYYCHLYIMRFNILSNYRQHDNY